MTPLKVLLLEDCVDDAEAMLDVLVAAGVELSHHSVANLNDYQAGLAEAPDLILADERISQWDGVEALRLLREQGLDIPFIIIADRDDTILEYFKRGAADGVRRDQLAKLPAVVTEALQQKELRQAKQRAEADLSRSEACLRILHEIAVDWQADFPTKIGRLLQLGVDQFGLPFGRLARVVDRQCHLVAAVTPEGAEAPGGVYALEQTYCHKTVEQSEPLWLESAQDTAWREHPAYQHRGMNAYIGIRVMVDGQLYGTLSFAGPKPRQTAFQPIDRTILQRMAEWVGGEIARHQSEQRFRDLFEDSRDAIYITTRDGCFVDINPAGLELFGCTRDEIRTLTAQDFYADPEDRYRFQQKVLQKGFVRNHEVKLRRRDGTEINCLLTTTVQRGADNSITGYRGIIHDITELKRAEEAVRESEALYRSLVQTSPDAIILTDLEGRLLVANQHTVMLHGYQSVDEVIGIDVFDLVAPEDVDRAVENLERLRTEGSLRNIRYTLLKKDGTRFPGEVSASLIVDQAGNPKAFIALARDIGERLRVEKAEREQRVLAEALAESAATLNGSLNLDEVLDRILTSAGRVVPHDGANIMFVEGGIARVVRSQGHYAELHVIEVLQELRMPVGDVSNLNQMAVTGCPQIVPDVDKDAGWVPFPGTEWVRSYLAAPIHLEGEVIGFLNLDSTRPNAFTLQHGERLQAFANQAAVAIQNARLFEKNRRRADELETLRRVTLDITTQLDLDTLLRTLIQSALQLLGTERGSIYLYRPEHNAVEKSHGVGPDTVPVGYRLKKGEGLVGKVWERGRPLIINEYATWAGRASVFDGYDFKAGIGVPVRWGDEILGVIVAVTTSDSGLQFHDSDANLLSLFADQAAIALYNAHLYRELETANESLEQAVAERTEQLRRTKEQVETILDSSPDAILLLGSDGCLEIGNPAIQELFGYTFEEIIERGPLCLVAPQFASAFMDALVTVMQRGEKERLEVVAQRKDGSTLDVDVALAPVWEDGKVLAVVCSLRDISALKEVERMKDLFVSNVSHELRTPITSLSLSHGLISVNPQKQDLYLARMRREIDRLSLIIEDLLRLSLLDQGREPLILSVVDINQLASQYGDDRALLAKSAGLQLRTETEPGLLPVVADEGLLGQVLSILLTNAINYTPPGGHITIRTRREWADGRHWVGFSVSDSGPGVRMDEQAKLFERFYRGQSGQESGAAGTGLGLSIAKEIIHRHHGRIGVASEGVPGKGATFTVWLPATMRSSAGTPAIKTPLTA